MRTKVLGQNTPDVLAPKTAKIRTCKTQTLLTKDELEAVSDAAARRFLSVSSYIRMVLVQATEELANELD